MSITSRSTSFIHSRSTRLVARAFACLGASRPNALVFFLFVTTGIPLILSEARAVEPSFDGPFQPVPAGGRQSSAVAADVDGDGRLDVVATNYYDDDVSILIGNGDLTFAPPVAFTAGTRPRAVVVADFDGDSFLDLAVANEMSNDVSVLLGNGDGTFGPKTDHAAGSGPYALAVATLDAGTTLDLVVANRAGNSISVLLGNGDGTFGPATDVAAGFLPNAVAIGDLNGDTVLDLVVPNMVSTTGTVSLFLGTGAGGFGPRTTIATGSEPTAVALGDIDGDDDLDLAVAHRSATTVAVFPGLGNGSFGTSTGYPVGFSQNAVLFGDFDTDDDLDLAVATGSQDGPLAFVSAYEGDGLGGFTATRPSYTGPNARSLTLGDFDADGHPDLAAAALGTEAFSMVRGNGDATFGSLCHFATPGTAGTSGVPGTVGAGDLNGDTLADLVFLCASSGSPQYFATPYLGNGDGTFGPYATFDAGNYARGLAMADVDADEDLDLAVANGLANTVSVLLGNGDGTFAARTTYATGSLPASVAIGDVRTPDGKLDLVVGNSAGNPSGLSVSVLLGLGNGVFLPKNDFWLSYAPSYVAIGDLTGDAIPDLAVTSHSSGPYVMRGTTYSTIDTYTSGAYILCAVVADLNDDALKDMALTNGNNNTVAVYLQNPAGVLTRTDYPTDRSPRCVAAADVTGDGRPDLLTVNAESNTVSFLRGNGDGTFAPRIDYGTGPGPSWLTLLDANQDGTLDVATTASFAAGFLLLQAAGGPVDVAGPARGSRLVLHTPFVSATGGVTFAFSVPRLGAAHLDVFDVRGRRIWGALLAISEPGEQRVQWQPLDAHGIALSRGVYLVRLDAAGMQASQKLVLRRR